MTDPIPEPTACLPSSEAADIYFILASLIYA